MSELKMIRIYPDNLIAHKQPTLALDYYFEHLKGTNDQLIIVYCIRTKHEGPPFASPEYLGVQQRPSNEKIAKYNELCTQVVNLAKEKGMECEAYLFYHSKRERALENAIQELKPHTAVVDGRCSEDKRVIGKIKTHEISTYALTLYILA
ncbi:hypothetical protein X801_02506, partial [Opisthorchis viverrini]